MVSKTLVNNIQFYSTSAFLTFIEAMRFHKHEPVFWVMCVREKMIRYPYDTPTITVLFVMHNG